MKIFLHKFVQGFLVLALAVISADAQVDLSGTWEFEKSTSPFLSAKTFQNRVVIKQTGNELVINSTMHKERRDANSGTSETLFDYQSTETYFADRRGEVNRSASGDPMYSQTEWKKTKLRITFVSASVNEKNKEELGIIEFNLSKDGNKLFIKKNGNRGFPIPFDGEGNEKQGAVIAAAILKNSLAHRKDTFKLVSK